MVQVDICNKYFVYSLVKEVDAVVHFAAESHVDNSIKNGKPFVRTNVEGTFNLLEVARQNPNLKKFIQTKKVKRMKWSFINTL